MIGDSAYPSLLQGVSQQVLQHRKEGQLSAQTNMLSDVVTGLRRRPGVSFKGRYTEATDNNSVRGLYTEYDGVGYHIILNSKLGKITILNADFTLHSTHTNPYLVATDISKIRTTTVGGYSWFLNTSVKPTLGTSGAAKTNPNFDGFFYIVNGAYSKTYTVTITSPGFTKSYTYTTPNGAGAGDLALSTSEGIATGLVNLMLADATFTAKYDIYREQGYVFLTRKNKDTAAGTTAVTSAAGKLYMIGSGIMNVPLQLDLPANLPVQGSNCVCSVGQTPRSYSYFKWDDVKGIWREVGSFDSADTLRGMPLRLKFEAGVATLEAPAFEGRLAGDEENNPYPAFTTVGITGIGAYQGRLVLLAAGYTTLSASNRPLRFMRSTTVDLRSDDPIEIGAGALASASFEYAVGFNKDLLLFSNFHQAVIPAGNTGITSGNAMVVLSSTSSIDTLSEPKVIGRTVMYGTDISSEFFGVGELVPSQYSEAQYIAQNLTEHIPRYIPGRCRNIVSSSSSNMGLFLSASDYKSVLVNEYIWNGDDRVQNSFHKWRLNLDVLSMHFVRGVIVVIVKDGGSFTVGTIDPRAASYQQAGSIPPFLDFYTTVNVVANKFTLPAHLRNISLVPSIRCAQLTGALSGEPIGIKSINTATWEVEVFRSFPSGNLAVGWMYSSSFTPSPPLVRDKDGKPIISANANVLKYLANVRNTGEFDVSVDILYSDDIALDTSGLKWSSTELGLGNKQAVDYGTVIIPVRAKSEEHLCSFSIDSTREMNVISIEYTIRGVSKRKQV
jgi:hypothetical protein